MHFSKEKTNFESTSVQLKTKPAAQFGPPHWQKSSKKKNRNIKIVGSLTLPRGEGKKQRQAALLSLFSVFSILLGYLALQLSFWLGLLVLWTQIKM
jgi:hypothetical protein